LDFEGRQHTNSFLFVGGLNLVVGFDGGWNLVVGCVGGWSLVVGM